jgi:hypothetical protein
MNISELANVVAAETLGAPSFTVEAAVRDAAIEFFTKTLQYQVEQDASPVPANTSEIDLDLPSSTTLAMILTMQLNGLPLKPITRDELERSNGRRRSARLPTTCTSTTARCSCFRTRLRLRLVRCAFGSLWCLLKRLLHCLIPWQHVTEMRSFAGPRHGCFVWLTWCGVTHRLPRRTKCCSGKLLIQRVRNSRTT